MNSKNIKTAKEVNGIKVGSKVDNFSATDIFGNKYQLEKALEAGKVVLIFIRGQWCPFCNKHLKHIQENLPKIYEKDASVVVISPETSEFIKKTINKTGAEFTIIHDQNRAISNMFQVNFKPAAIERFMYNTVLGAKLKTSHSDDTEQLPIPATFIIDQNNNIPWRHFETDHKKRASISEILKAL